MFKAFGSLASGSRFMSHGTLWRKVSRHKAERVSNGQVRRFKHAKDVWLETTAD